MKPEVERNLKLYAIAGSALILVTIAIIIDILVFLNNKTVANEEGNDLTYVENFATTNGFSATVTNNEARLTTTISSLAKGSNGEIINASPNDVISAKLTGFVSIENQSIIVTDTILQAIGKLIVLKQTTLGGYLVPVASQTNQVTGDKTIMEAFESLQSQIFANPFIFSVGTATANDNLLLPLWGTVLSGSTTLVQNSLFPGSLMQFTTSGQVTVTVTSNTMNVSFLFGINEILLNIATITPGTYTFTFETIAGILEDGVTCSTVSTLSIFNTSPFQVSTKDIFLDFVIDPTEDILLQLKGDFLVAVQPGTQIVTNSGSGYFLYRAIE